MRVPARLRPPQAAGHRHLLAGSAVLVVGAVIQAVSGAVFWLIAARIDLKVDVGSATKLFTSVLFVTYLAGLGLPVALARYAAARHDRDSDVTFTWGVLATTCSSVVFACLYLVLSPQTTRILTDVDPVLGPLVFIVGVIGSALSMITDVRCMTARRWNLVLARISLVGATRIPLLFLFRDSQDRALWLFLFAVGPVMVSGLVGAALVPKVAEGRHRLGPRPSTLHACVRYSGVNYVSTLAYQAPYFALPVIVLQNVTDQAYASFYVAWGIVAVAFYVPTAIGQALLAEGGRDGAQVQHQVRVALALAVSLMTAGAVAAFLGKGVITVIYGEAYHSAARVLPMMMAAGIPWAITSLYLSEARVLHRHVATVAITVSLTVAIVLPALVLVPRSGIDGASEAWFIGNVVAAAVAIAAIRVTRQRLPRETDPTLGGSSPADPTDDVLGAAAVPG